MHYVLVDDSIPFDGYTSSRRALGGAEKSFGALAVALVKRGHEVSVINRTENVMMVLGSRWRNFDDPQAPTEADVLIAFRKPSLLGHLRKAKHRILWVVGEPSYLGASGNAELWKSFPDARIMFASATQQRAYTGPLRSAVIPPAPRDIYFDPSPGVDPFPHLSVGPPKTMDGSVPPAYAVATTHPQHGLAWLVDLWVKQIHPQVPHARLAIYSRTLTKGLKDEADMPIALAPILTLVKEAVPANVVVIDPRSDRGMADMFRTSRVHLYPGHAQDNMCWTLLESQSAGLPAVARPLGGVDERIVNGETGYIVPDAAAFANVTVQILTNENVWRNLSNAASDISRRRTWEMAATEVEAMVADMAAATPSA